MAAQRLGFFTRLLEEAPAADRYRFALEQIRAAERAGFASAWVAQHHFHEAEGGLPSPFVLLAQAAAQTSRIVLGTAIVTLPLESPLRVAEDAAVLDLLSGGVSSSASAAAVRQRRSRRSGTTQPTGRRSSPATSSNSCRLCAVTFSPPTVACCIPRRRSCSTRCGRRRSPRRAPPGSARPDPASCCRRRSRTPRRHSPTRSDPSWTPTSPRAPARNRPRVFASRGLVVVDDEAAGRRLAARGIERSLPTAKALGYDLPAGATQDELLAALDIHVGTPEQVVSQLRADHVLAGATDIVFQVHPADPPRTS